MKMINKEMTGTDGHAVVKTEVCTKIIIETPDITYLFREDGKDEVHYISYSQN